MPHPRLYNSCEKEATRPDASGPLTSKRASFFVDVDLVLLTFDVGGTNFDTCLAPESDPVIHWPLDDGELELLLLQFFRWYDELIKPSPLLLVAIIWADV